MPELFMWYIRRSESTTNDIDDVNTHDVIRILRHLLSLLYVCLLVVDEEKKGDQRVRNLCY